jgi:Rod binding domain-containing protein
MADTLQTAPVSLTAQPKDLERMAAGTKSNQEARQAAEEFEATFLTSMLESMFQGIKTEAPFGGGHAEQQYRSILLGEYASEISKTGGIGIADAVYREILAIQEG